VSDALEGNRGGTSTAIERTLTPVIVGIEAENKKENCTMKILDENLPEVLNGNGLPFLDAELQRRKIDSLLYDFHRSPHPSRCLLPQRHSRDDKRKRRHYDIHGAAHKHPGRVHRPG